MAIYENVLVNAQEARDAASQIDTALNQMKSGIEKLNSEMNLLHGNTETAWEKRFNDEWNSFYRNKFPTVVRALEGQSSNLKTAAAAAEHLDA